MLRYRRCGMRARDAGGVVTATDRWFWSGGAGAVRPGAVSGLCPAAHVADSPRYCLLATEGPERQLSEVSQLTAGLSSRRTKSQARPQAGDRQRSGRSAVPHLGRTRGARERDGLRRINWMVRQLGEAPDTLACSMMTRVLNAVCSCSLRISPRLMARSDRMPIVATSASACPSARAAAGNASGWRCEPSGFARGWGSADTERGHLREGHRATWPWGKRQDLWMRAGPARTSSRR